jgi:hypothetical protein
LIFGFHNKVVGSEFETSKCLKLKEAGEKGAESCGAKFCRRPHENIENIFVCDKLTDLMPG